MPPPLAPPLSRGTSATSTAPWLHGRGLSTPLLDHPHPVIRKQAAPFLPLHLPAPLSAVPFPPHLPLPIRSPRRLANPLRRGSSSPTSTPPNPSSASASSRGVRDDGGRSGSPRVRANDFTVVSVLGACAHLGDIVRWRRMHQYLEEHGFLLNLRLATSLVGMYAKCGAISEALEVFWSVPMESTDILIWNARIGGLAVHGMNRESLQMFQEMGLGSSFVLSA
ncbi:hypothetical protein GUJ93_ZPchr0012g19571 [Zizania palustris]|uniref:Pentatricopeptide repeat-containing protein n=1 Tax=Zizania palustris TaxID=103762 RepID=A0A8J6BPV4_ZIZPA|nr:hypothetical protein GUJ93_ZPchr0012g19571 [Zizania palustris]